MEALTPVEDTDSPSSLLAEPPTSESQDQSLAKENEEEATDKNDDDDEERKLRRLERRKALALARSLAPKLAGGANANANNTIDLTNEDDDPSNRWFKRTFNAEHIPKKTRSPEDAKRFAVPRTISKNAPKSLLVRETLQNKLKASMSAKRRKAQEQRRKMYEEDNEHLKAGSEEEEEEEVVVRKKKVKKPAAEDDEYDSEDDEDYKPPDHSDEEEGKQDDEVMSVNLLNDSFTYDVFNNAKRSGPGSIVSNFDTESNDSRAVPTMSQMFGAGNANGDDLLDFCSGRFDSTAVPDTLQMLLDEQRPENPPEDVEEEEEEEEEEQMKKRPKKKSKRILDSDEEEEEDDVEETPEVQPSLDVFAESESLQETVTELHLTRVVISGDEDSEPEEEDAEDEEEEEPEDVEEEENPEDVEEEEQDIPEPNFDDEEDELAVLKRIEHREFKKQMKKRTLFDDEASLSGDDVGSDLDDEEEGDGENAYEAEEGDADDVPDDATIRRQNFKMLLKQENDKETRALAKLQEKLLADGDLGGVETNRQFRFKLREEVEINMEDEQQPGAEEDDGEEEEDEAKKRERAERIKYRIEHADELLHLEHSRPDDEDDAMFRRAGSLMRRTERVVVVEGELEERGPKALVKPSLLSKTALAVSFQEVLSGGGAAAPKQMYVQNFDKAPEKSRGAVKRAPQASPNPKTAAKRVRSSKLSSLE